MDASGGVGDFAAGSAGIGVLGEPENVGGLAEFFDVVVGPRGAAGDVGAGAAEARLWCDCEDSGGVGAEVFGVFGELVLVDVGFVSDGVAVDLCGVMIHEVFGRVCDFWDRGVAEAKGVDDFDVGGLSESEELVDLGLCGGRDRGGVGCVATDAEAADAKGVEELDERTILGDEVGWSAVSVGEQGEGFEAEAEEVRRDGGGGGGETDGGLRAGDWVDEAESEGDESDADGSLQEIYFTGRVSLPRNAAFSFSSRVSFSRIGASTS